MLNLNPAEIRILLAKSIAAESAYVVPDLCAAIGLAEGTVQEAFGGKQSYATKRLRAVPSEQLIEVAKKLNDQIVGESLKALVASLSASSPVEAIGHQALAVLRSEQIASRWKNALARRSEDPEGAITLARTLIEDVCKTIIVGEDLQYSERDELPQLYRQTATILNLAPDQHTEEIFRTILGNCQSIVGALGSIRNRLGDAHSIGPQRSRPNARHASLAVNLAGTMATFLADTWQARQPIENNQE